MIILNGESKQTLAKTVGDLVSELKLNPVGLVIEHNSIILKHEQWAKQLLRDNDHLELITFVGGG